MQTAITFLPQALVGTMGFVESLNPFAAQLPDSGMFLRWVNVLCAVGILLAFVSGESHRRAALAGADRAHETVAGRALRFVLWLACALSLVSVFNRWGEVNHFPSQTMSEVLVMFSTALLLSMAVLQFALGMRRDNGHAWATVDDTLVAAIFAGAWATNHYSTSLSTAQRDLPPALQSYWFAPHLSSLIFSYATLGIAALLVTVFFSLRFWTQLRETRFGSTVGGRAAVWALLLATAGTLAGLRAGLGWVPNPSWFWVLLVVGVLVSWLLRAQPAYRTGASLVLTVTWMAFLPFGHFVTLPILMVVGLVVTGLARADAIPTATRMGVLERTLDDVSFRAFAVGFPFLTAGLFMGAFWAQEAWANYWGWDSKENTALISWLIYVLYVHLRLLGGYRGAKSMGVLVAGALSIFLTFQIFGYLPDSQKSMHRYTDDGVVPREGMQGLEPETSARVETEAGSGDAR